MMGQLTSKYRSIVASGTVRTETLTISGTGTLNAGGVGNRTVSNVEVWP